MSTLSRARYPRRVIPAVALLLATTATSPATLDTPDALEAPDAPELAVPVVHAVALMTGMRIAESILYPDPFSRPQHFAAHYRDALTKLPIFDTARRPFEWDGDPWPINVFGHGLFGSELYLRARTCRLPWYGALAFAAASSTVWEYAFEGNGVRPSALDLVYTPLAGIALGEGRFVLWRAAGAVEGRALRGVLRAAVDPFGEIERGLGAGC